MGDVGIFKSVLVGDDDAVFLVAAVEKKDGDEDGMMVVVDICGGALWNSREVREVIVVEVS